MSAGITITVDTAGLDRTLARIATLDHLEAGELMTSIGALGESQTRRRITDEKTGPDGEAWAPTLEGTPILVRSGQHLLQSVAFSGATATEVRWGAAWEFAHVHQFGATIKPKEAPWLVFRVQGATVRAKQVTIPPRPFVGLSADNAQEIEELVSDWLGGLFE